MLSFVFRETLGADAVAYGAPVADLACERVGAETFLVAATQAGTARVWSECSVSVYHADDWVSTYYHLENIQLSDFQIVERNDIVSNYANDLATQVIANYGQLRVSHAKTGRVVPKAYVKVYARMRDGRVKFYKDGYTDLRGRFDYGALSTNELDNTDRFSILIMSDEHGAVVKEAARPKE